MKTVLTLTALATSFSLVAGAAQAATYYAKPELVAVNDWNAAGNYASNPDGTGDSPASLAGQTVDLFGRQIATSSGDTTFAGSKIILGGGTLHMRNTGTKTVAAIDASGASTIQSDGTVVGLSVTGTFNAPAGTTTYLKDASGTTSNQQSTSFSFATLSGSGDLVLTASSGVNPGGRKTLVLTVDDGTAFTGTISWDANTPSLQFGNDLVLGGWLIATDAAARITLDKNVTFAGVTINGVDLAPGIYTYSQLNSAFDTIFNDGEFSGSITVVPEPASMTVLALAAGMLARRRRAESAQ